MSGHAEYANYQPTNIWWMPRVPRHWRVGRTKQFAQLRSGHTPSRGKPEYWENCTIPWFSLADVWQLRDGRNMYLGDTAEKISERGLANSAAELLPAGTVILSRTASVGFSGIMSRPMATTQDFVNWIPGPDLLSKYLLYVFRSMGQVFDSLKTGSTHKTIYVPDVLSFSTPVPPLEEQTQITRFLDYETARTDALIEKQQQLIALLQEKRQAVISHAVTKGLNPDAPLRDSGIEWLGMVPAHWELKRLKHVLSEPLKNGISPEAPERGGVQTFSIAAVRDGRTDIEGNLKMANISLKEAEPYWVKDGDVMMMRGNGSRDLVGSVGIVDRVPGGGCIYPDILIRLRFSRHMAPRFGVLFLNCPVARPQIETGAKTAAGIWKVSGGTVSELVLPVPPRKEQEEILLALSDRLRALSRLCESAMAQRELLQERRTALISAAVTGKIDVRGWKPPESKGEDAVA